MSSSLSKVPNEIPIQPSASAPVWAKNLLFFVSLVGGSLILFGFLMSTERVKRPLTFAPEGDRQTEIEAIANRVDAAFEKDWDNLQIQVAPRADDLVIARRLTLGLAGTLPSVEELREYELQEPSERVHWLVSRLLEDARFANHVAERLARGFIGVDEGPLILYRRRRFVKWLSDQILENRPYDQLARELLTGEGIWTDTPAVNFYTKTIADSEQPDPIVLAGRTSRAFLGMRIDCLQCHDDFIGTINLGSEDEPTGGMQTDFHALASFFSATKTSVLGIKDSQDAEGYRYKLLDEEEESLIEPEVPFNRQFDGGEERLRERLANWVTHPENRPFARAIVNRVWAIMCGQALVNPVDDIPLDGPFPPALEVLSEDFVEHGFDVHRLIRVIAETDVFQRDSDAEFNITNLHTDKWAVFPLTRLRPDQVAGAIVQSTSLTTIDSAAHILTQLMGYGQRNDFMQRFGDAGEDEFLQRGETVTQRLLMLNGSMIKERITNAIGSPIRVAVVAPSVEKVVETVYLAVLTRRPTDDESAYFVTQIEPLEGEERTRRVLDLYWGLINGLEFTWNH